jgi:hypothetical protein
VVVDALNPQVQSGVDPPSGPLTRRAVDHVEQLDAGQFRVRPDPRDRAASGVVPGHLRVLERRPGLGPEAGPDVFEVGDRLPDGSRVVAAELPHVRHRAFRRDADQVQAVCVVVVLGQAVVPVQADEVGSAGAVGHEFRAVADRAAGVGPEVARAVRPSEVLGGGVEAPPHRGLVPVVAVG